jgi:hypothetical protein
VVDKNKRAFDPLQAPADVRIDENSPEWLRDLARQIADAAKPSDFGHMLAKLDQAARDGVLLASAAKVPPDHPLAQALAKYAEADQERREREIEQQIEEGRRRKGGRQKSLKPDQVKDAQAELERALRDDPKLSVRKNAEKFVADLLKVSQSTAWRRVVKPVFERRSDRF